MRGGESGLGDYKGFDVTVDEKGVFRASKEAKEEYNAQTLKSLHEQIDRDIKTGLQRKVLIVVGERGWGGASVEVRVVEGTLSSIKSVGSEFDKRKIYRVAWKDSDGTQKREERAAGSIYPMTPENVALMEEHAKVMRIVEEALKLAKVHRSGMKPYGDDKAIMGGTD